MLSVRQLKFPIVLSVMLWVGVCANASATTASLTLEYTCIFPLLEEQPLLVDIHADIPDTIPVGQMTDAFLINAEASVSNGSWNGLNFLGARSLAGVVLADASITGPALSLDLSVPMDIPEQAMPAQPGDFVIDASGSTPPLMFSEQNAGQMAIRVGDLVMTLRPEDSNGALTGVGEFESQCQLTPGQDNTLHTFTVGGGADTDIALPVTGHSLIRAGDGDILLDGQINGALAENGALIADISFAATQSRLRVPWLFGLMTADAEIHFEPVQQVSGLFDGQALSIDALMHVQIPAIRIRMLGLPLMSGGGPECRTVSPVALHLASPDSGAFDPVAGGALEGRYDLPSFADCGGLDGLVSLFMSGAGNSMSWVLGSGDPTQP